MAATGTPPAFADPPPVTVAFGPLPAGWTAAEMDSCAALTGAPGSGIPCGRAGVIASGAIAFVAVVQDYLHPGSLAAFEAIVQAEFVKPDEYGMPTYDASSAVFAPTTIGQFKGYRVSGMRRILYQVTLSGDTVPKTVQKIEVLPTKTFEAWHWVDLGGGQSITVLTSGVAHRDSRTGGFAPEFDRWEAEAEAIVQGLRIEAPQPAAPTAPATAAALPDCRAALQLPPGLKPGDPLAPSATVTSADGKPVTGLVQTVWTIGGRQANSVVWDGAATTIVLQLSCQGHAQEFRTVVPAYVAVDEGPGAGPGAPPVIPPLVLVPPGMGLPGLGLGAPPVGLEGVNWVPGPKSLGEALVGILTPAGVGAIGTVISVLGRGVAAVAGAIPGAPPATPGAPAQPTAPEKPEDKQEPKPPLKPDAATARARTILAKMRTIARSTGNPEFQGLVARAAREGFRPDGSVDPRRWPALERAMKASLEGVMDWANQEDMPGSLVGDAARESAASVAEFLRQAKEAAQGMGHALTSPIEMLKGIDASARQWIKTNQAQEIAAFQKAMKEGRTLDALKTFVGGAGKGSAGLLKELAHEVLPIEEFQSLFSKDASLEERLWAIPAAAAKIAGLLMMQPEQKLAQVKIPGLPQGSLLPSAQTAAVKMEQAALQAERALERAATGGGTRQAVNDLGRLAKTARATQQVETLVEKGAVKGAGNFKQMQRMLAENPELAKAADEALAAGQDKGDLLYGLRQNGSMSEEAHNLVTARKLQLQEQAMNAASKRIVEEEAQHVLQNRMTDLRAQGLSEAEALKLARQEIPGRYHTFNATQGNRSFFGGANAKVDSDMTVLGVRNVSTGRMEQIVEEEARRAGMSRQALDMNVYNPERGLSDATGHAANSQTMLENVGQTTGTSQQYQVHITQEGRVVVSDGVAAQGREAVLEARNQVTAPLRGQSAHLDEVLDRWVMEGHQGPPVQVPPGQRLEVLRVQMDGLSHATDLNQAAKYANRATAVGMDVDPATRDLLRQVAGQKDPFKAGELLKEAGITSKQDLLRRLGRGGSA